MFKYLHHKLSWNQRSRTALTRRRMNVDFRKHIQAIDVRNHLQPAVEPAADRCQSSRAFSHKNASKCSQNSGAAFEILASRIRCFCAWRSSIHSINHSNLLFCNADGLLFFRPHDVWARSFLRSACSRLKSPKVWSSSILAVHSN
jgi:hypothetical protein